MGIRLNSTSGKVLASAALIGAAASVAGLGTYGAFTSTTSASETVSSGTVEIALGASGTADNRLDVAATGILPGDTVQRAVTLTNTTGSEDLSAITLTTTASTSSILDTDATNGLKVTIESCPDAWTESAVSGGYTYTCSVAPTTVLAQRAIIGSNVALSNLAAVGSGETDNLRVTVTLPAAANNDFQGKTSTVQFSFTGTQRTATDK